MRINEDFIDSIDSDSLQSSVDETKPRSYEDFEHRFDVVLTSMKYRLLGSDKFDMKFINMIILILKKAPYIPDFVIEVQNMTTIDYVDYDPLAGNYKEFADFHKTLNGEQVVYRFGFDMDKQTPFGWFTLLIVKLLRLLNSTYSSKWTEPGLSTSDYRYNALMNAEYNSRCILPGDMKLDNPVNPAESLLVLHNCWREAEMPYVTVRDTNKILDSWQPVYKEDYGLLPLAFGRPTDAWWSLVSYYHYVASRQKHSLIIGSYIQDTIIPKMSVIMSAIENMDPDQNYKYVIEEFEPDCQNGHDMIICFDSKLTKKHLQLLPIIVFQGGDVEVFIDCPEWDINDMVSYFQTVCYSADVLSLILHIQRIGGLKVGQTSGFGFARCLRLIADNKYFSEKGLFKSPDMVLEVVQENDKMCKITRKK